MVILHMQDGLGNRSTNDTLLTPVQSNCVNRAISRQEKLGNEINLESAHTTIEATLREGACRHILKANHDIKLATYNLDLILRTQRIVEKCVCS